MLLQGGSPISTASWLRNGSHSNDYSSQTLASFGLRPSGSLTGQLPGASQVPLSDGSLLHFDASHEPAAPRGSVLVM